MTINASSHTNGQRCAYDCARCDAAATAGRPSPCLPATDLATPKQVAFLRTLAEQRECGISPDAMEAAAAKITKREASTWIEAATAKARKATPAPVAVAHTAEAPLATTVPEGRYAVTVPGHKNELSFYKLDKPTEGRWAGYTFLKLLASDTEYPVRGAAQAEILALIAADAEGAARLYGQQIGACCRCGRTLTDDASRAAGIGPECIKKMGW